MIIAIITGGRDYADRSRVTDALREVNPSIVVCGGATGADTLAREEAIKLGIQVVELPANWTKWGKAAGPKRNILMADMAELIEAKWGGSLYLIAFPGGRGTAHMTSVAAERNFSMVRVDGDAKVRAS